MGETNNKLIWWRLRDAWIKIAEALPLVFIPFAGIVVLIIIYVDQIGIAIKMNELKKQMPDHPEFRNIFKYYLIGILAPIVGPLFWSKAMNEIMKFLGTKGNFEEDIEFVENKGKTYKNFGIMSWILYYIAHGGYLLLRFLVRIDKLIITHDFLNLLIIIFVSIGLVILTFTIITVVSQVKIIKRLVHCIHNSGLDSR